MSAVAFLHRRALVPLAALALAAPILVAQTAPARGARPAAAAVQRVTLAGTVYDDRGAPLDSATVRVVRGTGRSATTGPSGRFSLANVPAQLVSLEVRRPGYHPLVLEVHVPTVGPQGVDVILFPLVERAEVRADSIARRADAAPARDSGAVAATPTEPAARTRPRAGRGLVGIVTDTLGAPLAGAQISIVSQRLEAITEADGRFALPSAVPGAALVRVRRLGYLPRLIPLTVAAEGATEIEVPLQKAGQNLGTVAVRAEASRSARLRGFEERRASGFGQFRTEEQWKARGPSRAADLLTDFNGVVILPNASGKRVIYGRGRCVMTLFIDNSRVPTDDQVTIDDVLSVTDVAAIEVYVGVASIPQEFAGRTNGCGAVVVWTKTGRDR